MHLVFLLFACCLIQSVILILYYKSNKIPSVSGSLQLSLSKLPLSSLALAASRTWLLALEHIHIVRLLDPFEYRVNGINPTSQNVTLKKINAPQNRRFVSASNQLCVLLHTSLSISVIVREPTEICLCSPPLPPLVLPDTSDVDLEVSMDAEEAMEPVVTEFDSLHHLQEIYEKARTANFIEATYLSGSRRKHAKKHARTLIHYTVKIDLGKIK